jgi:hypothetical protein
MRPIEVAAPRAGVADLDDHRRTDLPLDAGAGLLDERDLPVRINCGESDDRFAEHRVGEVEPVEVGMKLLLVRISGNTRGTLCTWLHQRFISGA